MYRIFYLFFCRENDDFLSWLGILYAYSQTAFVVLFTAIMCSVVYELKQGQSFEELSPQLNY